MSDDTGLRSELVGKGFGLIEFLCAQITEDATRTAEPDALLELARRRALVDRYQAVGMEMLHHYSAAAAAQSEALAARCRALANRHYADRSGYDSKWRW